VAILLGAASAPLAQQLPPGGAYSNGVLTVLGANGFAASVHSRAGLPALANFGRLPDGDYTYQLSAATNQVVKASSAETNGRRRAALGLRKGAAASGTFRVVGGAIVLPRAARSDRNDRD
jgi:hypothetical protein